MAKGSGAGIVRVGLDHELPIANAVLTVENVAQAQARMDDKRRDAARRGRLQLGFPAGASSGGGWSRWIRRLMRPGRNPPVRSEGDWRALWLLG